MEQDIRINIIHPILDQELTGLPCLYCGRILSRINGLLFCLYCRKSFKKDKDNGNNSSRSDLGYPFPDNKQENN